MSTAAASLCSAVLLAAVVTLGACSGTPRHPERPPDTGETIAAIAAALVGTRYHFGGADSAGFDCSGLALYLHQRVGLDAHRAPAAARGTPGAAR
ncbi:MAG: NlpC/P60 family protein [Steroidobacteraceae bacterium]